MKFLIIIIKIINKKLKMMKKIKNPKAICQVRMRKNLIFA